MFSSLHWHTVLGKDIDETAATPGDAGKRHKYQSTNVTNTERSKSRRHCGIGERLHQGEISVVDIHLIVPKVGGEYAVSCFLVGDCQSRKHGSPGRIVDGYDRLVRVRLWRPPADRSIQGGKQENRSRTLYSKLGRCIPHYAGGRTRAVFPRRRNENFELLYL